jgi:predicted nucleotidyltransferase component of viral defense system
MMNSVYREQVRLLLHVLPLIYKEKDFAVHGGTAINLFVKNLPRYSVGVDLTCIPIEERETSLQKISTGLLRIGEGIKRVIPEARIKPLPAKLFCTWRTVSVKIEVNTVQRGIIEDTVERNLCERAQSEFELFCKARTVSFSQLYGGKIGAALSRQHPRDLFDFKHMDIRSFDAVRKGFFYNILSSPKPVIELLCPHPIDQSEALENQFRGMTDIPFNYGDYEAARRELTAFIHDNLRVQDKDFLVSYEEGFPSWNDWEYPLSKFPSIQWKQGNIHKLRNTNPVKYRRGIDKLKGWLYN